MNEAIKKFTEEMAKALREKLAEPQAQDNIKKIKAAGADTGRFKVVISTADIDRHGESVNQAGWELDNYKKNPVVLWAHEHWSMPIGITDSIALVDGKLVAEGSFAPAEANPMAQQVRAAYDAGIITATSVGFIVKEMVGNEITKAELLEFSFVPVPANPFVEDLMKKRNLDLAEFVSKGLITNLKEGEPVENKPEAEPVVEPVAPAAEAEPVVEPAKEEVKPEAETTETPAPVEPAAEENKSIEKKELTPEEAGTILADMQSKVDTAITDAALAIQDLLASSKAAGDSKEKAGRVLSDKNRKLVKEVIDSLSQLNAKLQELYDATDPGAGKGEVPPIEKNAAPNLKVDGPEGDYGKLMRSLDDDLAVRKFLRLIDNAVGSALEQTNKRIKERSSK